MPTLHIHIYPLDMSCCVYPRISMLPIVHIYVPIWCVCLHCAKIKSMQIWVCNVCACLYLHVCIYKVSRRNKKPAAFSSLLLFMSCFHLLLSLFKHFKPFLSSSATNRRTEWVSTDMQTRRDANVFLFSTFLRHCNVILFVFYTPNIYCKIYA